VADNFELGDGTVKVRDADGSINPVRTPDGFTDLVFRTILAAADTLFRLNGKFPSVSEIIKIAPKVSSSTVSALLQTDSFEEALQYRGVTRDVDAGLSMEQQSALLILTDPHDNRTTAQKMKAMHVPMPRYQAWMKQPLFSSMYRKRMEDQFGEEGISVALRAILSGAEKGDVNSAMKLLEITGRYNPAQQQLEDVKVILVRMMEAIIKHADKDTRIAILADLEAETTSYALLNNAVQQRQIEGT
jgi:hypothetical protein